MQKDFEEKCIKMSRVTNHMYFIVPGKEELMSICTKFNKWLETKNNNDRKINIYISTALNLKEKNFDILNDDSWQVIYDLKENNKAPVKENY